jgi:hypothetical protein
LYGKSFSALKKATIEWINSITLTMR